MIGISYLAGGMKDLPLKKVIRTLSEVGYDAIEVRLVLHYLICGFSNTGRRDRIVC